MPSRQMPGSGPQRPSTGGTGSGRTTWLAQPTATTAASSPGQDAVLTTPFAPVPPQVASPDGAAPPPPVVRKSTAPGGANRRASPRRKVTRKCSADDGSEGQGRRKHRRRVSVGTDHDRGSALYFSAATASCQPAVRRSPSHFGLVRRFACLRTHVRNAFTSCRVSRSLWWVSPQPPQATRARTSSSRRRRRREPPRAPSRRPRAPRRTWPPLGTRERPAPRPSRDPADHRAVRPPPAAHRAQHRRTHPGAAPTPPQRAQDPDGDPGRDPARRPATHARPEGPPTDSPHGNVRRRERDPTAGRAWAPG